MYNKVLDLGKDYFIRPRGKLLCRVTAALLKGESKIKPHPKMKLKQTS